MSRSCTNKIHKLYCSNTVDDALITGLKFINFLVELINFQFLKRILNSNVVGTKHINN
jgi:hypothetical protein